jgi:hypothetical protein
VGDAIVRRAAQRGDGLLNQGGVEGELEAIFAVTACGRCFQRVKRGVDADAAAGEQQIKVLLKIGAGPVITAGARAGDVLHEDLLHRSREQKLLLRFDDAAAGRPVVGSHKGVDGCHAQCDLRVDFLVLVLIGQTALCHPIQNPLPERVIFIVGGQLGRLIVEQGEDGVV